MDDLGDGVQPQEGQGAGASDAPYAEYLNRIPEEARGEVEPIFKEWDANTTRRFQEAAQYRQQWEPYEQAGVRNVDPQELQGWMQFRQATMENPQAIAQWYDQYAQTHGLTPQQAAQQEAGYVDPELESVLEQRLQQHLGPMAQQMQQFQAWQQAQEQQRAESYELQRIEQQLADLASKHGDRFSREGVERFIMNHIDSNPDNAVQAAWDDYQQFVASIEKQVLDSKLKAGLPPEAGGGTATGEEPIRDLKTAGKMAEQMIRAQNQQ